MGSPGTWGGGCWGGDWSCARPIAGDAAVVVLQEGGDSVPSAVRYGVGDNDGVYVGGKLCAIEVAVQSSFARAGVGADTGATSESWTWGSWGFSASTSAFEVLDVFLGVGAGTVVTSGSWTWGSWGCSASTTTAFEVFDVRFGVGAGTGATSGSWACFADLEVLLGVGAVSASLTASSVAFEVLKGVGGGNITASGSTVTSAPSLLASGLRELLEDLFGVLLRRSSTKADP